MISVGRLSSISAIIIHTRMCPGTQRMVSKWVVLYSRIAHTYPCVAYALPFAYGLSL